jgi:transposase
VWYQYSPRWHGKYPQEHLADYAAKLQVDAYAGFAPLFVPSSPDAPARVLEISCMAHVRRKLFDVYETKKSPLAQEALECLGAPYKIEEEIRGRSARERQAARQERAVPLLNVLHAWMTTTATLIDKKCELAVAFNYTFNYWEALKRYT